ncbi:MAG: penicillin-binding protein 2 [Desulfobacterales bacterium]
MSIPTRKYLNLRVTLVAVLFTSCFIVIGAKATYLQIYRGAWLAQMAAEQYQRISPFSGKRGTIYDHNMMEMAVSIKVTSIAAYPSQMVDSVSAAKALAKVLNIKKEKVYRKLTSQKPFVWIKRQATPRETQAVKNLQLMGIGFLPEYNRFYPNKSIAAQILGFTGIDGDGLEGIEFNYDRYLKGAESNFTVTRDALGNGFISSVSNLPKNSGHNITLTIDRNIQYISEKALLETVTEFSAKSGIAIVLVPKTGAVLALAHYPFFNPNAFAGYSRERWRNRAITDPFEPGSTMKIFSATAAIESGGASPNSIFFCENGAYRIGRNVVHDLGAHGWLSLQHIIKYSSNIGAVKVSEMIGPELLHNTLRNFGFGEKTRIDCPGESPGNLTHFKKWSKLDTGAISFGHGIAVSAIQLISAVAAIANDGILMRPYLVKEITDQNGKSVHRFVPRKVRRVISAETARIASNMMQTVIAEGGTGVKAALDGYSVCGKTGTTQKINEEGMYAEGKYMASFIGFTPAENPEIAVLVVIDEPQGKYYGGIVAAPAFKKIAHEVLNYLNIPPSKDLDRLTASR